MNLFGKDMMSLQTLKFEFVLGEDPLYIDLRVDIT